MGHRDVKPRPVNGCGLWSGVGNKKTLMDEGSRMRTEGLVRRMVAVKTKGKQKGVARQIEESKTTLPCMIKPRS